MISMWKIKSILHCDIYFVWSRGVALGVAGLEENWVELVNGDGWKWQSQVREIGKAGTSLSPFLFPFHFLFRFQ